VSKFHEVAWLFIRDVAKEQWVKSFWTGSRSLKPRTDRQAGVGSYLVVVPTAATVTDFD